jgi:hypothetical protein
VAADAPERAPLPARTRGSALLANSLRGLAWAVPFFCVFWPIAIGICAGVWGSGPDGYSHFPHTPLILAVYAGILGAVSTPLAAYFALKSAGRWYGLDELAGTAAKHPVAAVETAV